MSSKKRSPLQHSKNAFKLDSKALYKVGSKLGILGGGQLAQMLAIEGLRLGLEVHILSEKSSDPAALVNCHWHEGVPSSEKDQSEFCQKMDYLTFESEYFAMDHFMMIQEKKNISIFPSPKVMQKIQHRFSQKSLMKAAKIPTAKFLHVQNFEDLQLAAKEFQHQFVLKKSIGGYDGYGTYYCKAPADLEKLKSLMPGDFIAEELISFKREFALILARSADGSFTALPLVETQQTQSRCDWVTGPQSHAKLKNLTTKLKSLLQKENYVGVLGVELFDTGKDLLVNELAPRVHNSGHYSQNALQVSQFQLHLLAGLGAKLLPAKQLSKSFAMVNLIGEGNSEVLFPKNLSGTLHWYGKKENRLGRKLGHVNYLGESKDQILKLALKERKGFQL